MTVTPYQIIVPVLSLVAIAYAWSLFNRNRKTLWEVVLWALFWGAIAAIAMFPRLLTYLTIATGIRSQVNAVIVTAIGVLTFLMFSVIVRLEELSQRYAKIMRALALRDADLDQKKPGKE
jgi:hypothetical protein